jgi:transposase
MIQIAPQMRIVAAIEPADFRRGIDGLARLCKDVLKHDPFNGWVFVFRNRSATALQVLLAAGDPEATQAAPVWRAVSPAD